jgi:predicted alpha/beta-hydrolase family hydrolase
VGAESFVFDVDGSRTTGLRYASAGSGGARAALILAHGAGAPQTHPWMVRMAGVLASRGLEVFTFNFLYTESRRRVPDKNDVLEATWRAAADAVRARSEIARGKLLIGGKSMGGRIATQVAAGAAASPPGAGVAAPPPGAGPSDIGEIAGLVLLGYPLHPPGRPDKLRTAHLPRVMAPMLFVQGSRDAFGTPAELEPFVAPLAARGTRLLAIEGGDHSLVPLKSSGVDLDQVMARVADEVVRFSA